MMCVSHGNGLQVKPSFDPETNKFAKVRASNFATYLWFLTEFNGRQLSGTGLASGNTQLKALIQDDG